MYVLTSRHMTDDLPGLRKAFEDYLFPAISRQPGFKSIYLMTKPDGTFLIESIWDSEAQGRTWIKSADHQRVTPKYHGFFKGQGTSEGFDLAAYTMVKS